MNFKQQSPPQFKTFLVLCILLISFPISFHAQCNVGNTIGSNDPENDFFWGQSFTAECDGTLEYIEFITGDNGGTQSAATLNIFEGETVAGTPLYTQETSEMTFGGAGESLRVLLDEPLPVIQGQKYTFEMQVFVNLQISTSNPYNGGIAFENGTGFPPVDFVFNVQLAEILTVEEIAFGRLFELYPNPANNKLNIATELDSENIQVTLTDVLGKTIRKTSFSTEETQIDISKLAPGIYFAVIEDASGKATIRFIKN